MCANQLQIQPQSWRFGNVWLFILQIKSLDFFKYAFARHLVMLVFLTDEEPLLFRPYSRLEISDILMTKSGVQGVTNPQV